MLSAWQRVVFATWTGQPVGFAGCGSHASTLLWRISTSAILQDVEQVERREPGGELLQFLLVDQECIEGATRGGGKKSGGPLILLSILDFVKGRCVRLLKSWLLPQVATFSRVNPYRRCRAAKASAPPSSRSITVLTMLSLSIEP